MPGRDRNTIIETKTERTDRGDERLVTFTYGDGLKASAKITRTAAVYLIEQLKSFAGIE